MKDRLKEIFKNTPVIFGLLRFIRNMTVIYPKWVVSKIAKNWVILNQISLRLRPWLWKLTGVKIQGKVSIADYVYYDVNCAKYITIEDGVWIAARVMLLCHKRNASTYFVGDDYNNLPYQFGQIILGKGCVVGMGSIVMPGVTIGEGAMIGAGSVVTKDIPAWTVAVGNPAKVVKQIQNREN